MIDLIMDWNLLEDRCCVYGSRVKLLNVFICGYKDV